MPRSFKPRFDFSTISEQERGRRNRILASLDINVEPSDVLYGSVSVSFPIALKEEIMDEAQSRSIPVSWVIVEWLLIGRDMQKVSDNWE